MSLLYESILIRQLMTHLGNLCHRQFLPSFPKMTINNERLSQLVPYKILELQLLLVMQRSSARELVQFVETLLNSIDIDDKGSFLYIIITTMLEENINAILIY